MQSLDNVWQQVSREFEAAQQRASSEAAWRVTDELNQLARRLKQYASEDDWYDALLDGAARFARQAAAFAVSGRTFFLRGSRGLEITGPIEIPLDNARAFSHAVSSAEPAVILCTRNEVSANIADAAENARAFVFALANGERTVSILFATLDEKSDVNALELIAQMASAVLRRAPSGLSQLQSVPPPAVASKTLDSPRLPAWADLPEGERLIHARAQRMARSKVARMDLYKPEACQAGATQRDLYLFLKREIDESRAAYRNQFMSTNSMVDYLHCELLRQLAANDESLLGADYPGQMA
jgi:hypothetical protein